MLDVTATRAQLGLAELGPDSGQFVADDDGYALRLCKDVQQVLDLGHNLLVLRDDLVLLQAGKALQSHLQNFLSLRFAQSVQAVVAHADTGFQAGRAIVVGIDHATVGPRAGQHFAHQLAVPRPTHQFRPGDWRGWRIANDGNELIDIRKRNSEAFKHMTALACLAQREHSAARDDFAAMFQEYLDQVFQVAQLGLAVDQRHHVDAEGVLQLGLLVQVVQHHFGHFAPLELDHQAHAGLVGLVLDVADAFDLLLMHQFGHALLQRLLVDLIRKLIDDDGLALAAIDVLEVDLGAHHHLATTGAVAILDTIDAIYDSGRRKIRRWNDFHQVIDGGRWMAQ